MSPRALPTPCGDPTCPELTRERYCEGHSQQKWEGDSRPSAGKRGYGAHWRKVRSRYIRSVHGLCERCTKREETTPAKDVHHKNGDTSDNRFSNLEALCRPCHNRETHGVGGR